VIRLERTRATLRRILGGPAEAWLRAAIAHGAEVAATEGIGSLAVFARVIHGYADRLTDDQLAAISGALAEDLPIGPVAEESLVDLVRAAFEEAGAAS
jgi:hypothetical protein